MTADDVIKRWDSMSSEINVVRPRWEACRAYCTPDKITYSHYTTATSVPPKGVDLHDSTAINASQELGAAFMHWLCSPNEPWLKLKAKVPGPEAEAVADKWTEKLRELLAGSNFYDAQQDVLKMRVVDGTAAMLTAWDAEVGLYFEAWRAGSFGFSLSPNGQLDCVIRCRSYSAKDAVAIFGEKNLPTDVVTQSKAVKTEGTQHGFLHCIYRRKPKEIDAAKAEAGSPQHMPIGSLHVHIAKKKLSKASGFWAMPVSVSRYDRMALDDTRDSVWGSSPAMALLPSIRAVNDLAASGVTVAKVMAKPRVLVPTSHEGPVDMRPLGITRTADTANGPREWATSANLNGVEQQMQRHVNNIERGFMSRLVNQFGGITKQMTAEEVIAKQREALVMFGSPIARTIGEGLKPTMKAAFVLAFENGVFGAFPEEMKDPETGEGDIPEVTFSSKIMIALEEMGEAGFVSALREGVQMEAIRPGVLDVLKVEDGFRQLCRSKGVRPGLLRNESEVQAIQANRAQQQQAAQQQEAMAKLASNPGTIKAITDAMGGGQ